MLSRIHQNYHPWLHKVEFTSSRRPILLPEEIELVQITNSNFYEDDRKILEKGVSIITSLRVLYIMSDFSDGVGVSLDKCNGVSASKPFFGSSKIHLQLRDLSKEDKLNEPDFDVETYSRRIAAIPDPVLSFSTGKVHNHAHESIVTAFRDASEKWRQEVLQRKPAAVDVAAAEAEKNGAPVQVGFVGIGGLLEKKRQEQASIDKTLDSAFRDIDTLMKSAQDVLSAVSRLLVHTQSTTTDAAGSGSGGSDSGTDAEQKEIDNLLVTMGIASPVTRSSAGALFHEQLARQLCDFLMEPLNTLKVMSLADAYCLYCKARGTELISPDDMDKATALWEPLQLPLKLRKFPSGAKLIYSQHYDMNTVLDNIHTYIRNHVTTKGVSVLELSQKLSISLTMIKDYIQELEQQGKVCRDITQYGVYYFPNRFLEFTSKYT